MSVPAQEEAAARLLSIINSSWMSHATHVAVRLGIADLLHDGPKRIDLLAEAADCHAASLERLMRALISLDICSQDDSGDYGLTPMGRLLCADSEDSLHAWTLWWGKYHWPMWSGLQHSIKTGKAARSMISSKNAFTPFERDAEMASVFNAAMVELSQPVARSLIRHYDFSGVTRVVDVGGGHGEILAAILNANPKMQGTLHDLPHAIEGARRHMADMGVADRCDLVAGDFLASVPGGADLYILKNVLHNWNDEDSARILGNCRRAMPDHAVLLVVEQFMPASIEPTSVHRAIVHSDLNMLVTLGAGERGLDQFRQLFRTQGFTVNRIVPMAMNLNMIECLPGRPSEY
ncbi:MAG: methyltransferase [Gallionellaceae bacterium]|nr:methyltransferase [Gallionellaceae bacterium]MDD5365337.1 methyltransferase [Gallionellaceae bacterium]